MLISFLVAALTIELALAVVVWRAGPARRDNRLFSILCLLDALGASTWLSFVLDKSLWGVTNHVPTILVILLGNVLMVELAYAFPLGKHPPRWLRALLWGVTFVNIGLSLHPKTLDWFLRFGVYFLGVPFRLLILALFTITWRRLRASGRFAGVGLVAFAFWIRMLSSVLAFNVGRRFGPEIFDVWIVVHLVVGIVLFYVLLSYALLRFQLMTARDVASGVVLYSVLALCLLALLWLGTGFLVPTQNNTTRVNLVLLSLAPLVVASVWGRRLPRLEEALGEAINPRRELRRGVLAKASQQADEAPHPARATALVCEALREVAGGEVSFLAGPDYPEEKPPRQLPPELEAPLRAPQPGLLHKEFMLDLSADAAAALSALKADALIPVGRQGKLFGALSLWGGRIDQDTWLTATGLIEPLALRLGYYSAFRKVTRLEIELAAAQQLAALGTFAAAIAHDIRTPLTSIRMNVQILRGKSKLPASEMEYFDIALEELDRLNDHVGQLLSYAKPVRLFPVACKLKDIIEDTLQNAASVLQEKKITIEQEHEEDLPPFLGDPQQLRQTFTNLVVNAAQASPLGATLWIHTCTKGEHLVVSIKDKGKGIAAENLPKIFEPFFTTRPDGTGLGLAIAKKIILAHQGEIQVESSPGTGTTMTVLLPKPKQGEARNR